MERLHKDPPALLAKPARVSFVILALTLILVGWLRLSTPLLAVLFSYFVLQKLDFARSKWVAVALFTIVLLGIAYGLAHFINQTIAALPKIADEAIPVVIDWAEKHNVELPFTDYQSLRSLGIETVKKQATHLGNFANFARGATAQFVFLLVGAVVAMSIFLNPRLDLGREQHVIKNNLYSLTCDEIARRFSAFYQSFATVMGAQIIISAINTALTSIFVLTVKLPYAVVIIGVTFLCGLLPVIGNLVSNAIIVCIAFTMSPKMALVALVFLIVIHKLEYFLNSKIVGERIKNPVWLTLVGLVVGERLMGLPGMVLAPVVLHYLKFEASRIRAITEEFPKPAPEMEASRGG
jgi:predicted PurR-regulated permease PerM